MIDTSHAGAGPVPEVDGFVASCRWVADAHLTQDPDQVVAALCGIYGLLASRGWLPPQKASLLLRLHASAVDVALAQLVDPSPRGE